jgi:hypothetical protein
MKRLIWSLTAIGVCALSLAGPTIGITREGSRVKIAYRGTLNAANALSGPWIELTNAPNPFIEETGANRRFYRSWENDGIFSSASVLHWTLTGPFQTNFSLAYAGTPDGIFPPKRLKPYFDARVKMGTLELPVTMRVRGNSSLQECPFPKLKLKVSKENRAGTPFSDAREIKIGTHCAEGGRGNIGRLRDERAAWREALAYEVMDALGFVTPRVRRAVIEYHDSGERDDLGSGGWVVTRHGFIAEDIELVADRIGGRPFTAEEIGAITNAPFDPQLVVDLKLLHALLGNWDFGLEPGGRGIWNTEVIEFQDKHLLPVAGDFDLASFVTESVRLSTPRDYHPELDDVERQALYTVETIREAGEEEFTAGLARFAEHADEIEGKISAAEIDDAGRLNALRHVAAFFAAVDAVVNGNGGARVKL